LLSSFVSDRSESSALLFLVVVVTLVFLICFSRFGFFEPPFPVSAESKRAPLRTQAPDRPCVRTHATDRFVHLHLDMFFVLSINNTQQAFLIGPVSPFVPIPKRVPRKEEYVRRRTVVEDIRGEKKEYGNIYWWWWWWRWGESWLNVV
ncbi:hypothetical protein DPEC_G00203560, partial [Dallia pectoralis]